MIKLHDSQSRELQDFQPQDPLNVTMYVCGPTVYGPAHIGNARPALVFDQLFRVLRHLYGEDHVRYARNVTDIDDKIIKAANDQGTTIDQITEPALQAYHEDLEALACLPPTIEPRATQNIQGMITLIKRLIVGGHAYIREGEVFFHVPSNPHPGLANHTDLQSGDRVAVDSRKKDPRDFVLWKPAKPGEPWWNSPWGQGRPGWHIECSAMIAAEFQEQTIDIHGGGQDLRFPHHEAECAQSHCALDKPLARYWLHNGLLTVNGEKMSKSRGNVILLNQLFERYPAESVRYMFLQSHYRSPMDFSMEALDRAHRALAGLYDTLYRFDDYDYLEYCEVPSETLQALQSDLNTPQALASLHHLANELTSGAQEPSVAKARLLAAGKILGLFNHTAQQWRTLGVDKEQVEALIQSRRSARDQKDYAEADRIRQELMDMGIALADGQHGTEWRKI
jgi:cysteinyl-tRNA synthetase